MEQLTFGQINEKAERLKNVKQLLEVFRETPLETIIKETDERRKTIVHEVYRNYCNLYNSLKHKCANIPKNKYIWCNVYHFDGGEFWVLNEDGQIGGAHIDVCPYCGADLKHQKGDVIAYRCQTDKRLQEIIKYLEKE